MTLVIVLFLSGCNSNMNVDIDSPTDKESVVSNTQNDLSNDQKNEYKKNTKNLTDISPLGLTKKFEEEDKVYVYFGRAMYPYCRNFVAKLNEVQKKKQTVIYYLDTENTDTDVNISEIRNQLEIEFVPSVIKVSNNGEVVEHYNMDSKNLLLFFED